MRCFASNLLTKKKEAPARLVNSLINALTETEHMDGPLKTMPAVPFLPRYILIVPDWDIVKHIGHYKFGVTTILQKVVKWIVVNMFRAIETRKEDLAQSKKGATFPSEPKIIWVKMINRVNCHDRALSVRNKFNAVLDDILADYNNHYVIDINTKLSDASYFAKNTFNEDGAIHFWLEINELIKEYDVHNISLKPIKPVDASEYQRLCMPLPPLTNTIRDSSCASFRHGIPSHDRSAHHGCSNTVSSSGHRDDHIHQINKIWHRRIPSTKPIRRKLAKYYYVINYCCTSLTLRQLCHLHIEFAVCYNV